MSNGKSERVADSVPSKKGLNETTAGVVVSAVNGRHGLSVQVRVTDEESAFHGKVMTVHRQTCQYAGPWHQGMPMEFVPRPYEMGPRKRRQVKCLAAQAQLRLAPDGD